ncbi:hypothetical protein LguiA_019253 [Lonicera macranthoides]
MAYTEDQQPNFKHFCRICRKGFMCGRALGGHMRAHGIGDESGNVDDEDQVSDWEDKIGGVEGQSNKRMYALRTNPNRLKSVRICENCGKEFFSWKSFLEHGKCGSDDAESLVSSPTGSDGEDDELGRRGCGWSKRKRSLRGKVGSFGSLYPSCEDEDLVLAKCLMALSNARVPYQTEPEPEESCASASKEEAERRNPSVAAYFLPFSRPLSLDKAKGIATKGMFECKACKKVFNSHQALGGHRASHKKVKGCFAARNNQFEENSIVDEDIITHEEEFFPSKSQQFDHGPSSAIGASRRKSKVHKCSICNRIFASGQALGGHKRCHWLTSNEPNTSTPPLAKYQQQFHHHHHDNSIERIHQTPPHFNKSEGLELNLNLPAPDNDQKMLNFEISTEINLQSWVNVQNHKDKREKDENNNNNGVVMDDEADSKVKLAKLSELKDMNMGGGSSPWLQVGLGSTIDVANP